MSLDEYHVRQLTGTTCGPRNCAAASGAMGLYYGSAGTVRINGDDFRTLSGVSCIPGQHSASGGLFISDVERVFASKGVEIDYGRSGAENLPRRWAPPTLAERLEAGDCAVVLGDYDALPKVLRKSATFLGDHSAVCHGLRVRNAIVETHWHDPLATAGIWVALSSVMSYWQKPGGAVSGYAGFVPMEVEVLGLRIVGLERYAGSVTVVGDKHAAVQISDRELIYLPAGTSKEAVAKGRLDPPLDKQMGNDPVSGDRSTVYVIGDEAAIVLAMDVKPNVIVDPVKAEHDRVKAAAIAAAEAL